MIIFLKIIYITLTFFFEYYLHYINSFILYNRIKKNVHLIIDFLEFKTSLQVSIVPNVQ